MRDGILKRKLNFTCNYRSSGAHGSVKRHFIPKPRRVAAALRPERRIKKEGEERENRALQNSLLPKMALSRCSDEREEAARDVTGK